MHCTAVSKLTIGRAVFGADIGFEQCQMMSFLWRNIQRLVVTLETLFGGVYWGHWRHDFVIY